jgi:NAD+ synthase
MLKINPEEEKQKIVSFLKKTFQEQGFDKAVIGLSGGIDSITSFYLLREFLNPQDIIVAHLFDEAPVFTHVSEVLDKHKMPTENIYLLSIKEPVDALAQLMQLDGDEDAAIRRGNIAARMRMITLFDLAKKHKALVTGTENRSEYLLSYFTRFGDQASDVEPIEHLYKTQVYQLAKHLGVPEIFITQKPTAGLWVGQTDEGEFGFSYEEADQVLHLAVDKKLPIEEIKKKGFENAEKILAWRKRNLFKHETPYTL